RGVFRGTLVAPRAKVEFEKDSRLEGAVYAKKIYLDKGVSFQFHEPDVTNNPPVADIQTITTAEDTPASITLSGSDPDGDSLTFNVRSQPIHGTLAGTAPDLIYTPGEKYNGADAFSFTVNDGSVDSNPATVNITVVAVNDAPVAKAQTISLNEDESKAVVLTALDAEGDTLAYEIVGQPSYGTLSGTAPDLTYTPGENYHGGDSFSFTVKDGNLSGNTALVSLTINPVNDTPVADAGSNQTVFKGDSISLNGSGSGDVDGDSLSYQWSFSSVPSGSTAELSNSSVVNPSFVPDLVGTYAVQLIVNDGTVDSALDTVVITANPRMTTVPNVASQAQADAESALIGANLTVGTISTANSNTVPAAHVISQNPVAGMTVLQGSVVDLMVSLGPAILTVPGVVGQSLTDAQATITEANLTVGTISTAYSDTIPADHVVHQVPAAGASIVEGSAVDLVVSAGPEPQTPAAYISAFPATIQQGESALLSWSSVNAQSAHIDQGVGVVSVADSIEVFPEHSTTYILTVTGSVGSASAQVTVTVTGNPEPQPEGSFGEQYEELVPPDATVEYYDPRRFAVISGLVRDLSDLPIADVSVTLLDHPEYGTSKTDTEGRFSLPMDGGATFTLVYQKQGLITSHRKLYIPWNDIAVAETIQMVSEDPISTKIILDGNPNTVVTHQSTPVDDQFGNRSATMVFTGDNRAYALDSQGSVIHELTTITTRATEYSTPESMPAVLPPTSGYTYCVEMSVDGVKRVKFDKPVVTWVNNFLGFDVGEIVPSGYYDRNNSEWVASDSGLVVKLLDTDADGIVDALDSTGDSQPNDLNGNGSFADEVKGLIDPLKYAPGDTFWRVEVTHFTAWDYNWAFGPPGDSIFPNSPLIASIDSEKVEDCNTKINSYVEDRSRIFNEDIPVPGTDLMLHYASNRVAGYKHEITVPVSGDTIPGSLNKIIVKLIVAGNEFEQILDPQPHQSAEFVWNGQDCFGNYVTNGAEGRIQIGFAYDGVYQKTAKFGYNGNGNITGSRTRQEVTLWNYDTIMIDAMQNKKNDSYFIAEGWTLSNHHYLDQSNAVLHKGDGTLVDNDLDGVLFLTEDDINGNAIETNGALLVTASGVNETLLANVGLYVIKTGPTSYLVNEDFLRYARLFGQNSIPTSILEPLEKYFVNPTSIKCINKTLTVTYSIAKDYHAGGGCYVQNTWSEPTETSHCIYYNNFYWYGSYYDPNYVKDTYNNYSIFYNDHYTPSGSRDFSQWFSKIYQAKTDRIYASLRYGAACLTSLTYNSENNPSYYYGNCEMQTGKEFIIGKVNLIFGKEIKINEENGTSHFIGYPGRHVRTIDTTTEVTLKEFNYDENQRLVSVTDQFGNKTLIQRDLDGIPTAIISPDGIKTELAIDINNNLTYITYSDGGFYNFEYSDDGLLTSKIDPRENQFNNTFDSNGRIADVTDPAGGHWQYNRSHQSNGNIITERTTGEGNTTTYVDNTLSTGIYSTTITGSTGDQTQYYRSADGLSVQKTLGCGMWLDIQNARDSEYGFKYVKQMTERTPLGLEKITLRDKAYEDTDTDDTPDLITETFTVNDKITTLVHNTLLAQKVVTSPESRTVTTLYSPATLLTESVSIPGLYDTIYEYDARGRLTSISTNTRQSTFAYNPEGFLGSVTGPENHTTTYSYDAVGRITGISRPDGGFVGFTYDKNGNMTVLTNPVEVDHGFGFNTVNLNSSYQTLFSGSYSYSYDKDRRLIQTNFPSGKSIFNDYADPADSDDKSRLWRIETPEDDIDFTYLCGTKVDSITKVPKSTIQDTESISYDYDGKLVTSETLAGTLNQSLAYTYNNDFDVFSFTYAGSTTNYSYDEDGLLTGAGSFTITRNTDNGLPEAVYGGALNLARTFNGYGEVDGQIFTVGSQNVTSWSLTHDNNGRITDKTDTVPGKTSGYAYTYDGMGRLLTVVKDGTLVEEYQYDLN
ncbi:MAG: tandem-95 repeat protein, partial [Deltaproteobacteria bacterium]|nr:tandem-95 repeat protein [Deltaproteobacteria bacterium]